MAESPPTAPWACAVVAVDGARAAERLDLLAAVLPHLVARELFIGVVLSPPTGADGERTAEIADRLLRQGACAVGSWAHAESRGQDPSPAHDPATVIADLAGRCDLVVVCGPPPLSLPTVRLGAHAPDEPAVAAGDVIATLPPGAAREGSLAAVLVAEVEGSWHRREVLAGVLIGGGSTRMGRPKHMARVAGDVLLERVLSAVRPHVASAALLGAGEIPSSCADLASIPDAPDAGGPLAGMLAAMRASPTSCWLFVACDMPLVDETAVGWLVGQRRPGSWVIQPRGRAGWPEPLFAVHEPMARHHLEALAREGLLAPRHLASRRGHRAPALPPHLVPLIESANTVEDLARLTGPGR